MRKKSIRFITPKEGQDTATQIGARKYLECSSLTGEGVDDVFEAATRAALLTFEEKKSGCCVIFWVRLLGTFLSFVDFFFFLFSFTPSSLLFQIFFRPPYDIYIIHDDLTSTTRHSFWSFYFYFRHTPVLTSDQRNTPSLDSTVRQNDTTNSPYQLRQKNGKIRSNQIQHHHSLTSSSSGKTERTKTTTADTSWKKKIDKYGSLLHSIAKEKHKQRGEQEGRRRTRNIDPNNNFANQFQFECEVEIRYVLWRTLQFTLPFFLLNAKDKAKASQHAGAKAKETWLHIKLL